jgi:hypothetical protein
MNHGSSNSLWYVYGIVPANSAVATAPEGIDSSAVALEPASDGRLAALVSVLRGPDYAPEVIEARSGDVEWLSPRAVAHDRVLTWASDRGAVIPLPMFSLFSGPAAIVDMLRYRGTQLEASLRRVGTAREYALRVYRVDSELLDAIVPLSPRLQELAATIAAASPGQRYLLERKLESEKRSEMRTVSQRIVEDIVSELAQDAAATERSPIPRVSEADAARGTMVLNAAFLVETARFQAFQARLSSIVERRQREGFRFDFTGPWPPYHFVNETSDVR